METRRQGQHRHAGDRLETFLVEWKQSMFRAMGSLYRSLETFLVEWKPAFSVDPRAARFLL